jgi:fatty acid-binding protein DegV
MRTAQMVSGTLEYLKRGGRISKTVAHAGPGAVAVVFFRQTT